jgi:hypothetical protein
MDSAMPYIILSLNCCVGPVIIAAVFWYLGRFGVPIAIVKRGDFRGAGVGSRYSE